MSTPELVTRHDRRPRGPRAEGPGPRRDRDPGGRRDPGVLLRAAARAGRRRVPHVPRRGRGHPEAAGRLHADRAGRDGRQDGADLRARGRGPERHARVPARQPPARLPGLRQGRRVPAPGPDVPLGPGTHAHDLHEAHVRQADPGQPADRARPRALHPLLPLHALLRGRRRGRPARRRQPRRPVDDRHVRGRAVPRAVLRQRDRALPGRRADVHDLPVRGAPVGDPERAERLLALPGRLQHLGHDARGQGQARPEPQPSRGRRGLALRQGPLRLPGALRARPRDRAARARRAEARRGVVGARARRERATLLRARGRPHRHGALGHGDARAGVGARAADARGARRAHGRPAGADEPRARPPSARRSPRSGTRS